MLSNHTKLSIIKKNSFNVSIGFLTDEEMKDVILKIEYYYGPAHAYECYRYMVCERRKLGISSIVFTNSEQKKLEDKQYRESCLALELSEHYKKFCKSTPVREVTSNTIEDKSILRKVISFLPNFKKHV